MVTLVIINTVLTAVSTGFLIAMCFDKRAERKEIRKEFDRIYDAECDIESDIKHLKEKEKTR